MRYQKPTYENAEIETRDIVLESVVIDPLTGVVLEDNGGGKASIFTSIKNLFKFSD